MKKIVINKSVTNWHIENVYRYMQDLYNVPQISKEEENILTERIRNGDESAINKLIEANLRFVITVAKQFQGQGLELDDLIAEGNYGLTYAARKFDNTKEIRFISYAVWWIRQAIMFAIAEQSRTVKIPMNKINNIIKINRLVDRVEQFQERDVSDLELFEAMKTLVPKITHDDFIESLNARVKTVSLDAPLDGNKDYDCLLDTFENNVIDYNADHLSNSKGFKTSIEKFINTLHQTESDVIRFEYDLESNIFRTKTELLLTYRIDDKMYDKVLERAIKKLKKKGRINIVEEDGF